MFDSTQTLLPNKDEVPAGDLQTVLLYNGKCVVADEPTPGIPDVRPLDIPVNRYSESSDTDFSHI